MGKRALTRRVVDEADHRGIAHGAELISLGFIIGQNSLEVGGISVLQVIGDVRLQLVLEVGKELQVVLEVDLQGLVVVGVPGALDFIRRALGRVAARAEFG